MLKRLTLPAWIRPGDRSDRSILGRLERQVMEILWAADAELCVRDVQGGLPRVVAYTTVMTTLDRLFKKGLATRRLEGRAYHYAPAFGPDEMEARVTSGLLAQVLAGSPGATRPFLSNLVDAVGDSDGGLLDELERLVREKRARIRRREL